MSPILETQCNVRRAQRDACVNGDNSETALRHKRLRFSTVDYSQFQSGALVKLRLENFVTYTLAEFDLSPSLNMIIGPNGSGKSTFVCAVCLGLAGKPEYIGRSKKVSDFIKNGEDTGVIEIILKNSPNIEGITGIDSGDEVITIRRLITRVKNRSEYMLNGRNVPESVIKLLISQLKIQLDNLCQFLSQERVEEFARLKSDNLLIQTIRSIDSHLLDVLNKLKQLQTLEINTQKDLDINKNRLAELTEQREKLIESVRVFKEYERKKSEIEVHVQLLPYVKVKDHKEKSQVNKREYEEAKSKLKSVLKDKKPYTRVQRELEDNSSSLEDKVAEIFRQFNKTREKYKAGTDELESIRENVDKKRSQNKYYRDRTDILESEIEKARIRLEQFQAELANMETPDSDQLDHISSQRNELIRKEASIRDLIMEVDSKGSAINHELGNIRRQIENRQKSLHSGDKIGILDQSRDLIEVKKAVLYIRSKPEMLGKVLEPPIMSVSVNNSKIAAYLAQCVDYNTCKALTIVDAEAYEKYADEILQRFKVNLRELSKFDSSQPLPVEKIRTLGFEDYLSNFVTGDSHVIQMLCQFSKIHTIPISRRELTPGQLSSLTQPENNGRLLFKRMIHGNKVVDIKRSLYGSRQVFMVDSNVKDTKFYQASIISEEHKQRINSDITRLKAHIEEKSPKLEQLALEKTVLAQDISENQVKINSLAKQAHHLNTIRQKYTLKKNEVMKLESDIKQLEGKLKKDVSHKIRAVEKEIGLLMSDEVERLQRLVLVTKKLKEYQKEHVLCELRHFNAQNLDTSMKDVISFFAEREEELTNEYNEKKRILKDTRNTTEYKEWIRQISSYSDDVKERLNEYAEAYEQNGTFNLDFIQSMVDKLESEIAMENHDESAITILSGVERELKQLEDILPQQVQELHKIKEDMDKDVRILEPRLDQIATRISARFSGLFSNVGSAGAVQLEKPHLFSDWKIEIMVKFRDNAVLKKLDSHTQSGGERAVSTVLYMIALQEFTNAPFRVVDEINQGMDSRNERIIHRSMVENACAENTSQYFLVTPKLLTDLHYHEKMRIHCVMAGPWIPDPVEAPEIVHFGETSKYLF